jgi:hypothetical protein
MVPGAVSRRFRWAATSTHTAGQINLDRTETNATGAYAGDVNIVVGTGNFYNVNNIVTSANFGRSGNINMIIGQSVADVSNNAGAVMRASMITASTEGTAGNFRLAIIAGNQIGAQTTIDSYSHVGTAGNIQMVVGGNMNNLLYGASTSGPSGGNQYYASGGGMNWQRSTFWAQGTLAPVGQSGGFSGGDITQIALGGDLANTEGWFSTARPEYNAYGFNKGGNVFLQAANGAISLHHTCCSGGTSNRDVVNTSSYVEAGNITVQSGGTLSVIGGFNASSERFGGNVDLAVNTGNLYFGSQNLSGDYVSTRGEYGKAGNINIRINQTVVDANGRAGVIGSNGQIDAGSNFAGGGNINLRIDAGIWNNVGEGASQAWVSSGYSSGGNISFTLRDSLSHQGSVQSNAVAGLGGNIFMRSTEGNINCCNNGISSTATTGIGGAVTLLSDTGTITVSGTLAARGSMRGGDVSLTSAAGITHNLIDTGSAGTGGNVRLNVTATGNVNMLNNIVAQGGRGSGGNV